MTQVLEVFLAAVFGLYVFVLAYVTVYCLLQLYLLVAYLRRGRPQAPNLAEPVDWPRVTVQLPLYNERYVAARIIDAVCAFDYPRERLQIQVLDDSTDETVDLVAERVAAWQARGVDIEHRRRSSRQGYKAGALAEGLHGATGEFVAIFDADFVPGPGFLRKSLPHFHDAQVGIVQSRWEHLNEDYSLITKLQALQLNVHFTVEQSGRRAAGLFAQFNGTAGVWRRRCIDDAGGWRALTLTEDLDLSMRAQLRGWRLIYLEDNPAPAELPMEMNALKSQQHRWMKGGAECARILLPQVWRSGVIGFGEKLHTTAHLLASSIFVFVFLIGVLSLPALAAVTYFGLRPAHFSIFLVASIAVGAVYYVGNVRASWSRLSAPAGVLRFLLLFPLFLCLSMGLSLHNGWAVVEGFRGKRTEFVRTPKFNLASGDTGVANNVYRRRKLGWITIFEGVLALVFAATAAWGLVSGHDFFVLFHVMLALGYGSIFGLTLAHTRQPKRAKSRRQPPAPRVPAAGAAPEIRDQQVVRTVGWNA